VPLLEGKRILVTGVLTDASLAFAVARLAQQEGAEIVLTGAGRGLSLTTRTARKLPRPVEVLELDVADPDHPAAVRDRLADTWGRLDGALHAIGFAPPSCLGGGFLAAPWADVAVAMQISAYSLKTIAEICVPLMSEGGSLVGLDFDATVAWPAYDWMGVAKAALESASRYLARDLGPKRGAGEPGGGRADATWPPAASPASPASRTPGHRGRRWVGTSTTRAGGQGVVALLSDWFPATTGEIVHVDGGYPRHRRLTPCGGRRARTLSSTGSASSTGSSSRCRPGGSRSAGAACRWRCRCRPRSRRCLPG
jgi:enoyl ACP reductase